VAILSSTPNKSVLWSIVVIRPILGEIIRRFMIIVIILVNIAVIVDRRISFLVGFTEGFWMGVSGPLDIPITWSSVRHPFRWEC